MKEKTKGTPFCRVRGRKRRREATGYAQNVSYLRFERIERLKALTYASRSVIGPAHSSLRVHPLNRPAHLSLSLFTNARLRCRGAFPRTCAWVFAPRVLETCESRTIRFLESSRLFGISVHRDTRFETRPWVSEARLIARGARMILYTERGLLLEVSLKFH